MNMKKICIGLCAAAAFNANAALIVGQSYQDDSAQTWTYVGDYNVGAGPSWGNNPPVYTALNAASLVFGNLSATQTYAISTTDNFVNHLAWYDGYGDGQHLPTYNSYGGGLALAENFFSDAGAAGYNGSGDYSAYVGRDRASLGGGAFNHVFVSATVNVPEPGSLALLGAGIFGVLFSRRKVRPV